MGALDDAIRSLTEEELASARRRRALSRVAAAIKMGRLGEVTRDRSGQFAPGGGGECPEAGCGQEAGHAGDHDVVAKAKAASVPTGKQRLAVSQAAATLTKQHGYEHEVHNKSVDRFQRGTPKTPGSMTVIMTYGSGERPGEWTHYSWDAKTNKNVRTDGPDLASLKTHLRWSAKSER